MSSHPNLYIIAGPNGAGKTTFAREFLPVYAKCKNFINADLIAQGLSPFSPVKAAMKAGRVVLDQIESYSRSRVDFAFETTLSGKTYLKTLKRRKEEGYKIHLFYLWIPSIELSLARIKERVKKGGHNVPAKDVNRRFPRTIENFLKYYRPLADSWMFFDNSSERPRLIAQKTDGILSVVDADLYGKVDVQ